MKTASLCAAAVGLLLAGPANAAEIKVLSTQATEEAYKELVPQFEKASGHKVTTIFTGTLDLQKRVAAGETYDLLIMAGPAIDDYIKAGTVAVGSRVDLAKSGHAAAVPKGGPKRGDAAKGLVGFLTAPAAEAAYKRRGLEPG